MFGAPLHRKIYLVLLALLGGCMVTSRGLSNVVWVMLLANWVLEGRWREKWQMAKFDDEYAQNKYERDMTRDNLYNETAKKVKDHEIRG